MNCVMGQKIPLTRAASTQYFPLDDDGDVLAARQTPPVEVRPQELQGHTAELIIETFVPVQVLVGESSDGGAAEDRHGNPGAGCRRAQGLYGPNPAAFCGTSYAESGTVGGSADGVVLLFSPAADCRADHRHSCSSQRMHVHHDHLDTAFLFFFFF